MTENEITFLIRKAIFEVYNTLGPGLLESVYEKALAIELENQGLRVEVQVPISVTYKGTDLGLGFRADILVEEKIIIEIKSVVELAQIHHKQLLNYLKLTNCHLGILFNFNTNNINSDIVRIINGYL
ncbi:MULTISPECIES: GxxExxY protein [unclassified Kaistella]|uniref:GxxExxY protein n=1 Tax=unclassified Kaistella TaxID=2762626 RepID=UPI00273324FF|nr:MULTISPECIES: GxxExxY protein [unclassified Kaistella]MDP2454322.1 GxxExxY protein [Kaistella sp. SH11-4b]MDP2457809.1 GxxExxY protein [Kaistella sp. SH40-3]MDP2460715.1 GxxExxY protein [Kaistella sp. SH19-2b]